MGAGGLGLRHTGALQLGLSMACGLPRARLRARQAGKGCV